MNSDKTKQLTQELFEKMGITATVVVKEEEEQLKIEIESEDSGLLIGYHGEGLQALQLVLGMMVNQGEEEWTRVIVDIDNYRSERHEVLRRLASRAAQRARELGEEQVLPAMSAFERRLIHIEIQEEEGVYSESSGLGHNRRVVVKPK